MTKMNDVDLAALLAAPESDRVERKESFSGGVRDRVYQAICAFANDYPDHRASGAIVIGQRDDRTFSDIPIDDKLITELAQICNNTKIVPVPSMTSEYPSTASALKRSTRLLGLGQLTSTQSTFALPPRPNTSRGSWLER